MTPPPFERTSASVFLVGEILRLIGRYEGLLRPTPQPQLRRQNRIKTIAATTRIEGNTLSLDQVTAVFDGKQVVGPPKDILEVQNAITAYEDVARIKSFSTTALLKVHRTLMAGLLADAGKFRSGAVGVFRGSKVVHTAPPADRVEWLVKNLLDWNRQSSDEHVLIRSAVVHYELAFIHPFADGNGRTSRLWQHGMLLGCSPAFEFVPMESVIQERQRDYYDSLAISDRQGSSTTFIEFSLQAVHDALAQLLEDVRPEPLDASGRLANARGHLEGASFSRKDYMKLYKTLSSAQASRDLRRGVDDGVLKKDGSAARTRYRFVRTRV